MRPEFIAIQAQSLWLDDSGSLQGHQLAGGLLGQCLHRTSALSIAKWAYFIPGLTVGGGGVVPASGRAGNRQATGLLFHFGSAMSETVVPRSQEYFRVLAAHSENPPAPSNKSTFSLPDEN